MKTVLIYSGGVDSTVLLYHLRDAGHELRTLGVNYGQRHLCELEAAKAVCERIGLEYQLADLSAIKPLLGGSALTGDLDVPEGHYTNENMKQTIVPNRNMIMLAIAVGWAVSLKYDAVAYAAHAGDHTIYPDCRPEFVEAMDNAAGLCDWHKMSILRPFIDMKKSDIVWRGAQLGVPFDLTWSCYKGGDLHCGKCGTCVERREAFELAGIEDPTVYADM